MVLVQLFAWFSDQMIWRINQVPDLTYIKFLKLLNLGKHCRRARRGTQVCFTASDKVASVSVPVRSRFEVPAATGSDLVYFETVRPIDLIPYVPRLGPGPGRSQLSGLLEGQRAEHRLVCGSAGSLSEETPCTSGSNRAKANSTRNGNRINAPRFPD